MRFISKDFLKKYGPKESPNLVIVLLLLFGVLLIFVPHLITSYSICALNYVQTGEIGDIISGTTMPFISFAGIIITFLAFWIQYRANIELKRDIEKDRVASRYYELLRLHKENVNEMDIDQIHKGREVFKLLHKDLKYLYWLSENALNEMKTQDDPKRLSKEKILSIAYSVFYYGFVNNEVNFVNTLIAKEELNDDQQNLLDKFSEEAKNLKEAGISSPKETTANVNKLKTEFTFSHSPFQGQMSRLGHYYRHLFQMMKFIDAASDEQLSVDEKYGYAKMLRGQLSVYEQAMLYYNALSDFGAPWLKPENPLLTKYRLIKNLPFNLADFSPDPKEKFKREIEVYKNKREKFFEQQDA